MSLDGEKLDFEMLDNNITESIYLKNVRASITNMIKSNIKQGETYNLFGNEVNIRWYSRGNKFTIIDEVRINFVVVENEEHIENNICLVIDRKDKLW